MEKSDNNLRSNTEEEVNSESRPLLNNETVNNTQNSNRNNDGLSFKQATLLIASGMAGGGILALPRALARTGWLGVPLIIMMCIVATFSSQRLGDCWTIIEERNPEMRNHQRKPYAIIANEALGKTWSIIVSAANVITLFCAGVIYLLIAAQIIEEELERLFPNIGYCLWYLILVACVIPFLYFKTPKDFPLYHVTSNGAILLVDIWVGKIIRFIGHIVCVATIIACILYFIQMMIDVKPYIVFRWGIHGFKDFFLAFGTIMFAFGGAPMFPTVQNDMADKQKFYKSLQFSFTGILFVYLFMAITGYVVYGEFVAPNLAMSIKATPLTSIANFSMVVHLLSAFVLIINPVVQEFEELYKIPRDSVTWRLLSRTSVMVSILFVGESIPKFHTILALVGGTTVALLTFVLPSYCYMKLVTQNRDQRREDFERPGWMRLACWEVIMIGLLGGLAATFSAISAILSTSLAIPCYLR